MRHQCTSCLREFFDDAPSASPPPRVFCVFCGTQLPLRSETAEGAVPFSADFPREQDFALGVIGAAPSGFPDTLRQFRVRGRSPSGDSLMPLASDSDETEGEASGRALWRSRPFWTSLVVGFGVGALAALFVSLSPSGRPPVAPRAAAAAVVPTVPAPPPLPAAPLVTCVGTASAAPAVVAARPPTSPALERRFWLERARAAQRGYHLNEAERFYRRALAQAPRDSEALAGLGEVELLRGTVSAADAHFHEALEANADYVPALVAVADIRWQSGQAEAAREAYRQIVEHYSADLYPPYVAQRSAAACVPQCQP
jgi:hypothetical protein